MFLSTEKTSELQKILNGYFHLTLNFSTKYSFMDEFGTGENYALLHSDSDGVILTSLVPGDCTEWTTVNHLYTLSDLEKIITIIKERKEITFSLEYGRDLGVKRELCNKEDATIVILKGEEDTIFEEGETLEENIADLILFLIK